MRTDRAKIRWRAHLFEIGDAPVSPGLVARWTDHGFDITPIETLGVVPAGELVLAWTGDDWEAGVRCIQRSIPEARRNAVLVGVAEPPPMIDPLLRSQGALGAVAASMGPEIPRALGRALRRQQSDQSFRFLDEFRTLSTPDRNSPFLLFRQAARIARGLLHCDLALIAIPTEEGSLLLLDFGEAKLQPMDWPGGQGLPHARLAQASLDEGEILVAPDLRRAEDGETLHGFRSAIAIPIGLRDSELEEAASVVSLYWERPFWPTVAEYRGLEVLAALCRAALLYTANRSRLAHAHLTTTEAFDTLHRLTAVPALETDWRELEARAQRDFVHRLLEAHGSAPYLEDLWAQLAPYSRGRSPWVALRSIKPDPPFAVPEDWDGDSNPIEATGLAESRPLLLPISGDQRRYGVLAAIFENRAGAVLAQEEMRRLAVDLALGTRFFRRSIINAAVVELTKILLDTDPPDRTLLRMARVVRDTMAADGCKIFVVRAMSEGLGVQQMCRTDREEPQAEPLPLDPERGLVDWVLQNGRWLLIDRPTSGERTGIDAECGFALDDDGTLYDVERLGRPETEFAITAKNADDEGAILLAPLFREKDRAGVLAIWRRKKDPFDRDLDTESLEHFAPHIASACAQVLQVEALQGQLTAVKALARDLTRCEDLPHLYETVLGHIARLARVPRALFLLSNARGHFFSAAVWTEEGSREFPSALGDFQLIPCERPRDREAEIELALDEVLTENGLRDLHCRDLLPLHDSESSRPRTYVALFAPTNGSDQIGIFGEDFQSQAVRSFLSSSGSMLEKHILDLRHKIVDEFFAELEDDSFEAQQILSRAAERVLQVTGADGALAYGGDGKSRKVSATIPVRKRLLGLRVLPGSHTHQAIEEQRLICFQDLANEEQTEAQRRNLERMRKGFGWKGLRSWLSCPVVHEGRYLGLLKILTSDSGGYLNQDHADLVQAIAHRAAWEIFKVNRHSTLNQLNAMSKDLVGSYGTDLSRELIQALESFIARFVREGSKLVVICRSDTDGQPLIQAASESLSAKLVEHCVEPSRFWNKRQAIWTAKKALPWLGKKVKPLTQSGIAVPFQLPGQTLSGHLFVFHPEPFSRSEITILREAARESATILNGERLREEWVTLVGMFRHALLGPVQGLTSAARVLADLAEEAGLEAEAIREPRGILEAEAEVIRLWRENQRLYMSKEPEIVLRGESLLDLLETSVERFRNSMLERRIHLAKDWPEKGSWIFSFDRAALDIAISNLLDNARKYSFANRIVTLGAIAGDQHIRVWVEDEGHPIPTHLEKKIYGLGSRLDFRDPARAIHGQGLGLPMARRMIEAHGGQLYHSSEPIVSKSRGKQAYRVRFTFEIPHHWRTLRG